MSQHESLLSEEGAKRRLFGIYTLLAVFCVLLFVASFSFIIWLNVQSAKEDFNHYSNQVHQSLSQSFIVNETILDGFAAYLAGVGVSDPKRARFYARSMMDRYNHLYMFQAAQRVSASEVPEFERLLSDKVGETVRVRRFEYGKGMVRVDTKSNEHYYPVVFVEPVFNNGAKTLGLDISSIQFTHEAMDVALSSGLAALSRPIVLFDGGEAFVMVKPSFKPGQKRVDQYALLVVKTAALLPSLRPTEKGYGLSLVGMGTEALLDLSTENVPSWQSQLFPLLTLEKNISVGAQFIKLRLQRQLSFAQLDLTLVLVSLLIVIAIGVLLHLYMRMHLEAELLKVKANRRLYHQANYDLLTGLANRHHFESQLKHILASALRRKEKVGLLYIDLNDFKYINDTFGHQLGDKVLAVTGAIIQGVVRLNDIPARFGGDEFVVCLEDIGSVHDARHVIERLKEAMAEVKELDGVALSLSASIGLSIFPEDGEDLDFLLKSADEKMYAEKKQDKIKSIKGNH